MQCELNLITKPLNNRLSEIIQTYDLKFLKKESIMQAEDTSQKDKPPSTIHCGSRMMSNRLLEGIREPMKQKEGSTMKKLSMNSLQLERS